MVGSSYRWVKPLAANHWQLKKRCVSVGVAKHANPNNFGNL
jgi:hypothetical protein